MFQNEFFCHKQNNQNYKLNFIQYDNIIAHGCARKLYNVRFKTYDLKRIRIIYLPPWFKWTLTQRNNVDFLLMLRIISIRNNSEFRLSVQWSSKTTIQNSTSSQFTFHYLNRQVRIRSGKFKKSSISQAKFDFITFTERSV